MSQEWFGERCGNSKNLWALITYLSFFDVLWVFDGNTKHVRNRHKQKMKSKTRHVLSFGTSATLQKPNKKVYKCLQDCAGAPGNIVALQIQSNRFRLFGCLCLIICSSGFQVRLRSLAPNCDLIVKGQIVEKENGKTFFFLSLWPIWSQSYSYCFLRLGIPPMLDGPRVFR